MVDHVKYKWDQLSIITFFKRFIFIPNNCGVKLVTFSHLVSLLKKTWKKLMTFWIMLQMVIEKSSSFSCTWNSIKRLVTIKIMHNWCNVSKSAVVNNNKNFQVATSTTFIEVENLMHKFSSHWFLRSASSLIANSKMLCQCKISFDLRATRKKNKNGEDPKYGCTCTFKLFVNMRLKKKKIEQTIYFGEWRWTCLLLLFTLLKV